jgi:hypothetical protein
LSRRANDSFLLLAWPAKQQDDEDLARDLCQKVGLARVPIMILLGIHVGEQLGVDTRGVLDPAALLEESLDEVLADLARRGWAS